MCSPNDELNDFKDKLEELLDQFIGNVQVLLHAEVRSLMQQNFPGLQEEIELAHNLGLLEGLTVPRRESTIFPRLQAASNQKANAARYLMQHGHLSNFVDAIRTDREPKTESIFFESGSTIAHLIGLFAKELRQLRRLPQHEGEPFPLHVLYNNLFVSTALSGLVTGIEPTPGSLDLHYMGFFPTQEDGPNTLGETEKQLRALGAVVPLLQGADALYCTSSELSLLYGPIVGSRQNALMKRAIFAAAFGSNKTTPVMIVHFEKLVGMQPDPDDIEMHKPMNHCHAAFPPDPRVVEFLRHARNVKSGTLQESKEMGEQLSVPIKELAEVASKRCFHSGIADPQLSWLQGASSCLGVDIIVAMPREDGANIARDKRYKNASRWLSRELDWTNRIFKQIRMRTHISIIDEDEDLGVWHVRVSSA